MKHPIQNRNFRWLFTSRIFNSLVFGFTEVPLMWWVYQETGQASLVAATALIGAIGALLAAPLGGVLADKGSKKNVIILNLAVDVVIMALLIGAVLGGALKLWGVYLFVALSALFGNLSGPAMGALVPLVLERSQYQKGNALTSLASMLGLAVSFALAGTVTGALGVAPALAFGIGFVLLAWLAISFVKEPKVQEEARDTQEPPSTSTWLSMGEGFSFVWKTPVLFWLIAVAMLLNLILAPLGALLAPYAKLLGGTAKDYGLLSSGIFTGQLIGLSLQNFVKVKKPLPALLAGTWALALSVGLLAQAPTVWVAVFLLAMFGVAASFMNVQAMTLIQLAVPHEKMGRVFGVVQGLNMGVQPLGLAAASLFADTLGPRGIFLIVGILMFIAGFAFLQGPVRAVLARPATAGGDR